MINSKDSALFQTVVVSSQLRTHQARKKHALNARSKFAFSAEVRDTKARNAMLRGFTSSGTGKQKLMHALGAKFTLKRTKDANICIALNVTITGVGAVGFSNKIASITLISSMSSNARY